MSKIVQNIPFYRVLICSLFCWSDYNITLLYVECLGNCTSDFAYTNMSLFRLFKHEVAIYPSGGKAVSFFTKCTKNRAIFDSTSKCKTEYIRIHFGLSVFSSAFSLG